MAHVIEMPPSKVDKNLTFEAFMSKRKPSALPGSAAPEPKTAKTISAKAGQPTAEPTKDGARRVTGSADIPLNADGKQQSKELAKQKATKPFDKVFSSPEKRAMQTAKEFGEPIELSGLDAWKRGALEGQAVDSVKGRVKFLMLNPDKRPSGKSPESSEPGESLNECARPLLATVQTLEATRPPGERWLVCSHGGDLQIIDAWGKAGKPAGFSFDYKKIASVPYWSVTGKFFILGDKGLKEVPNNDEEGVVYLEHSETAYNPRGAQDTTKPGSAQPTIKGVKSKQ